MVALDVCLRRNLCKQMEEYNNSNLCPIIDLLDCYDDVTKSNNPNIQILPQYENAQMQQNLINVINSDNLRK